jgi:hypothetical protein
MNECINNEYVNEWMNKNNKRVYGRIGLHSAFIFIHFM